MKEDDELMVKIVGLMVVVGKMTVVVENDDVKRSRSTITT